VDYDETGRPHAQVRDATGQLVIECTTPGAGSFWTWLFEWWEKLKRRLLPNRP
jgi:hypothetical protein